MIGLRRMLRLSGRLPVSGCRGGASSTKGARADNTPTGGKTPRNFRIDPTGQYLLAANQSTNNITTFKIDQSTGALTPTGQSIEVGAPVCLKVLAVGK